MRVAAVVKRCLVVFFGGIKIHIRGMVREFVHIQGSTNRFILILKHVLFIMMLLSYSITMHSDLYRLFIFSTIFNYAESESLSFTTICILLS